VVIFRRGLAPVIGRVEMAWKRYDVRSVARHDRRAVRRHQRGIVWTARRAGWAARWAQTVAALDTALTAVAAWVDRVTEPRTSAERGDGASDA
jgi:hypothetical protein